MLSKEQTKLEVFGFSDKPEDQFYCLLDNTSKSPGINVGKLSVTKPENLDNTLNNMGCLVLLSRSDLNRILGGSKVNEDELHERIYEWACKEELI